MVDPRGPVSSVVAPPPVEGSGGPAGPAWAATLSIDTLEFCYLLAGRRTCEGVGHAATGDPALVSATLTAAAALARL